MQKRSIKQWMIFFLFVIVIVGFSIYYVYFFTPKNSIELYQEISFADDYKKIENLMLEGYEGNLEEADFDYMKEHSRETNWIGQFTIIEYRAKTYLIMTTPGTNKLEILSVEELPEDVRSYFLEMSKKIK